MHTYAYINVYFLYICYRGVMRILKTGGERVKPSMPVIDGGFCPGGNANLNFCNKHATKRK